MKQIYIYTTYNTTPFIFIGKYRRDLEKTNWHYYEQEDGSLYHFRKEHLIAVFERNLPTE